MAWDFYTSSGILKTGVVTTSLGDADTLDGYDSSAFVQKAGDTITGTLTLSGASTQIVLANDPSASTHAVRKSYADATYLALSGGTITGDVTVSTGSQISQNDAPTVGDHLTNKTYVDTTFVDVSGDTMTGSLNIQDSQLNLTGTGGAIVFSDTTSRVEWDNEYISEVSAGVLKLNFQGAATRAAIQVSDAPVSGDDLANKAYVDSVAGGGGATDLNSLTDVTLAGTTANDILMFSGATWANTAPSSTPFLVRSTGGSVLGKLSVLAGLRLASTSVNANYSIDLSTDTIIFVDSSGGPITLTLPASHSSGDTVIIKDQFGSAATDNITVETSDSDTIDGNNDILLDLNYQAVTLTSDGTNWFSV